MLCRGTSHFASQAVSVATPRQQEKKTLSGVPADVSWFTCVAATLCVVPEY